MKLFLQGDRGKALCEHCQQVVGITYLRRDVPFSDGNGLARDILVGVCDQCATTVAIPPQSTPAIKDARQHPLTSIEARLPAVYLDVLDAAMHSVIQDAGVQMRKLFFSYYFSARVAPCLERVHSTFTAYLAEQAEARQLPAVHSMKRLSLKVNHYVAEDLARLLQATRMTQTELLKSLIAQMRLDVLEGGNPAVIADLRQLARLGL
ncbi:MULTISPECIES: hypothetical protein [Pseudomonas]|uniref:HNH endonuclease n=1 Tax=Pseudomonas idahonensis TaxID=2942628 RepID=A0ABT5PZC8_9PSED|nr:MULTISPECIES: hypothetical protein [Pseudomonas]MCY7259132.1 hypothetical protein [Pseudomonas protegens]MDD1020067.1 hypothetical protein [Pseudomonas idahonensis]MDD1147287.1 hypothetical protein [Pseudomonas idahonensis]MDP9508029.1 hypothetical protein [Pseudomonas protegens]PYC07252.1 hypothetical protein DMX09_07830 [Pseudomonas protegens]